MKKRICVRVTILSIMILAVLFGTIRGNTARAAGGDVDIASTFPDEIFQEYVRTTYDKDGDGKLSRSEIEQAEEVYLWNKTVTSMQGIEVLTNLTRIFCMGGRLTSLDVSRNTNLEYLYLDFAILDGLDVSNNKKLTYLTCYYCQLESLDVSANTELQTLNCMSNRLETLDVSKNTKLQELSCGSNRLTELDVSHNPLLTELGCEDNAIATLDLSNNPQLEYLFCPANRLTTLDLRSNPKLTYLACYNTLLKGLNISRNTQLLPEKVHTNVLVYLIVPTGNNSGFAMIDANTQIVEVGSRESAMCLITTGGTVSNRVIRVSRGAKATVPSAIRAGYYLMGWTDVPGSSTVKYSVGSSITMNDSLVLYAIWKKAMTRQPESEMYVAVGSAAKLTVAATGTGTLTYQWQTQAPGAATWKNSTASSAKTATLRFTMSAAHKGYRFRCIVTDGQGRQAYSRECLLDIPKCVIAKDFSDAAFRAYLSENCDTDADGNLSEAEIAATAEMDVSGLGIQSLAGIENFTELRFLYCSDNRLASLNVSANTALERLFCDGNLLTTLNLSNNKELRQLGCEKNKLTELDLCNNRKLTYLSCYGVSSEVEIVGVASDIYNTYIYGDARTVGTNAVRLDWEDVTLIINRDTTVDLTERARLTFDSNGGTGTVAAIEEPVDTTVTIPSAKPTRTNYTFLGWATSKTAKKPKYKAGNTLLLTKDTVLYAVWGTAPKFTAQPKSATITVGESISLNVAVTGVGTITYRWQTKAPGSSEWKDSASACAKTATFTLVAKAGHNGYQFRCVVKDETGLSATSSVAVLTVVQPGIHTQPTGITVLPGETAGFRVVAYGIGQLTYQWQLKAPGATAWKNSSAVSAKKAEFNLSAQEGHNGYLVRCVITDANGTQMITDEVTLKVVRIQLTSQMKNYEVTAGTTVTFSVTARGLSTLSYQWQVYNPSTGKWTDSTAAGAKTAKLSIRTQIGHNGFKIRCIVTDEDGNRATTKTVTITVN